MKFFKNKKLIFFLILFFFIGLFFYFNSSFSKLKSIKIDKFKNKLEINRIIKYSKLKLNKNLLLQFFKKKKFEQNIKNLDLKIKDVEISIYNINNFLIKIKENFIIGYLKYNNKYYYILNNGYVLNEYVKVIKDYNKIILFNFYEKNIIKKIILNYNKLLPEIKRIILKIENVSLFNKHELIKLYMNDGNQVILKIKDLPNKMLYYPQIINKLDLQRKKIIDMEVGIFSYYL